MTALKTTRIDGRRFAVSRWLNIMMGGWLVASAFVWPRAEALQANLTIVGVLIATLALYAIFAPAARRLNTLLAVWLLVSSVAVFDHLVSATVWNDIVVGLVVLVCSLPRDVARRHHRAHVAHA